MAGAANAAPASSVLFTVDTALVTARAVLRAAGPGFGTGEWWEQAVLGPASALAAEWWPVLPPAGGALVAGWAGLRLARRALHEKAAGRGYWLKVTPPRSTDPARAMSVWRLLSALTGKAARSSKLATLPLAFEFGRDPATGKMVAGVWLPGKITEAEARAELTRAWPSAGIERSPGPVFADGTAAWRLRAVVNDHGPLTDDPTPPGLRSERGGADGDLLRPVYSAIAEADVPVMVQVLVRPVPNKRMAALRHASRYPAKPRKTWPQRIAGGVAMGVAAPVRFLLDLFIPNSTPASGHRPPGPPPVEAWQRAGMDAARKKLADGPHFLTTIRISTPDAHGGGEARRAADGFVSVTRALTPARIRKAGRWLRFRRARGTDWVLVTAGELGSLARLPADPARYGMTTAAVHRPVAADARRPAPQHTAEWAWRGGAWTQPGPRDPDDPSTEPESHNSKDFS